MFDYSIWELALVMVVILLVIGPKQLPAVAYKLGLWLRYIRNLIAGVKNDIQQQHQQDTAENKVDDKPHV